MSERKFSIPFIIMSIAAFVMGVFALTVESIVLALITIILSVKFREKYLWKIQVIISVLAILGSAAFLWMLIFREVKGIQTVDYWFIELLHKIIH